MLYTSPQIAVVHIVPSALVAVSIEGGSEVFSPFGDSAEKKYSKRRSGLLFETGVEHFLEDRPLQARSCFIELLKYDRSDKIAKRYIQLCDKSISGGSEKTYPKYLTTI